MNRKVYRRTILDIIVVYFGQGAVKTSRNVFTRILRLENAVDHRQIPFNLKFHFIHDASNLGVEFAIVSVHAF
jgi:hypothetical protein